MVQKRWMPLAAILATVLVAAVTAAQDRVTRPRAGAAGEWRLIGQVSAGFTADHDVITVVGPNDNFRRIKFKVTDASLNLKRVLVTYDNGTADDLPVTVKIPKNTESRAIDLRGAGQRSIRTIEFWYETSGARVFKGKADVTVFGQK